MTLGIRPEHLTIGTGGGEISGKVRLAEYLGSETMYYLTLSDGTDLSVKADGLAKAATGADMNISNSARRLPSLR